MTNRSNTRPSRRARSLSLAAFVGAMLPAVIGNAQTTQPHAFKSAGNPIVADGSYYSADAATLSHDGKLYLYFGNDRPDPMQGGFVMPEYGVLSTTDPRSGEWELHRNNLDPDKVFAWATGNNAFAGHVSRGTDGRFYWYTPVEWKNEQYPDRMAIGVAVSDTPVGPWTDPIGKPLISWPDVFGESRRGNSLIDPMVLQDTDGQTYLYWGSWWAAWAVKLAPSMTETVGQHVRQTGVDGFFEAPWVTKRNDTYYMIYDWKVGGTEWTPSNYQAAVGYATATSPLGPWKYQGIILHGTSATTVHPSMIEHGGQWWLTYHTKDAKDGGHFRRSVAIDALKWDGDKILPVTQTWADAPAFRLTKNVAGAARASASHTEQPPMTLGALTDGRPTTALLPPDFWGNYRNNQNKTESDWVRYDWPQPVRLDGVGLQFHQDPNWIRPPASWVVEYLDDADQWHAVKADDYPTTARRWIDVSFVPVTTRAIRAAFKGRPNGEFFHSVSLLELEAYAVQAESLPAVPAVRTTVGQPPTLPATIDVAYGDAGTLPTPVLWEAIPESRYQTAGQFTAKGRVLGQAAKYVETQVTVGP